MPDRPLADAALARLVERLGQDATTTRALASATGIERTTLTRYLAGRGEPSLDQWAALAAATGHGSLEELLTLARRDV